MAKQNNEDLRLLFATQAAYLDGEEGETVQQAVDRIINAYESSTNHDGYIEKQYEVATYMRDIMGSGEPYGKNVPEYGNWKYEKVERRGDGFAGCLLDTQDGDAILGFRGSESYDASQVANDWIIADVGLLNNTDTSQQRDAQEFTRQVYKEYGKQYNSFDLTGHSLGGNLAEHATLTAPDGMKINRCVNFDGPGYSDEYLKYHAADIKKNAKYIDHYQWSWVGTLLLQVPGSHYMTVDAENQDGKNYNFKAGLYRHDTKNMITHLDKNGNVVKGDKSLLSIIAGTVVDVLEVTDSLLLLSALLKIANEGHKVIQTMKDVADKVKEAVVSGFNWLKDTVSSWFKNMFGPSFTGVYEISISGVKGIGQSMETASKRINKIGEEVADISKGLKYNSLAGSYYKSKLSLLCVGLASDMVKAKSLANAAKTAAQYASDYDGRAASCYS